MLSSKRSPLMSFYSLGAGFQGLLRDLRPVCIDRDRNFQHSRKRLDARAGRVATPRHPDRIASRRVVDSPPMSSMSAPSWLDFPPSSYGLFRIKYFPPSENESGVTLRMP